MYWCSPCVRDFNITIDMKITESLTSHNTFKSVQHSELYLPSLVNAHDKLEVARVESSEDFERLPEHGQLETYTAFYAQAHLIKRAVDVLWQS